MNYDKNRPIYIQIAQIIVQKIVEGEIPLATLLDSVRQMAKDYEVTPKTIQTVTNYLAEEKIINKKPSVGAVITNNMDIVVALHQKHAQTFANDYVRTMKKLGHTNETIKEKIEIALNNKEINND